jgi:hypothetical protein
MALKNFFMTVTDPDPKTNRWKWPDSRIAIRCIPDDNKPANTGKWEADKDVFGFRTGDNGWYYWRRAQGLLYLTRPDPNHNTLDDSLIRFFGVKEMTNGSMGDGKCPFPSPPAKGKLYDIAWALVITDEPDSQEDQPPPDQDEASDKDYRRKVDNASVDIRKYVEKPELQEKLLKQAKEWVGKIKNPEIRNRVKEDLEETEKNYMHKKKK